MNGGGGRASSDEDFGRCADGLAIIGVSERLQALVDKSDAQGRDDPGDGKCETSAAYRHNCRNLYPFGVDVILDHHLQSERHVMEERDQQQYHENGYERRC